jgi:hypothetical protein
MTARWSGVETRSERRRRPPKSLDLEVESWRVSHGARRAVSRGDVAAGARDVNVGCRSGFEAS